LPGSLSSGFTEQLCHCALRFKGGIRTQEAGIHKVDALSACVDDGYPSSAGGYAYAAHVDANEHAVRLEPSAQNCLS